MKIISFLLLLSINLLHATIYKYDQYENNQNLPITWTIESKDNELIITGVDDISITKLICSPSFEIRQYSFQSKEKNYTFSLQDNVLSMQGSDGKKGTYTIRKDWIQQFGFGLRPFMASKNTFVRFGLINPKDFKLHDMVAKKIKVEEIEIENKKYKAQKIKITLDGFKSIFWKGFIWFDTETNTFLKYQANSGPNTPMSTILLKEIK